MTTPRTGLVLSVCLILIVVALTTVVLPGGDRGVRDVRGDEATGDVPHAAGVGSNLFGDVVADGAQMEMERDGAKKDTSPDNDLASEAGARGAWPRGVTSFALWLPVWGTLVLALWAGVFSWRMRARP